ncbi:MAG: 2-(1,2-epoxy-1,2-dihydrophenyl)acetyl-CoA isomerase, partial [Bacteroidetes bacterium]
SGGTFTLPRLIGFQKASALMMLGDKVSATEAEKLGMLYKVFPAETLQEETKKIAETLAALPTKALALTKQALNQILVSNSFEAQLQVEDELQFVAAHTTDYAEGIQAFVEKRSPKFTGQ